MSWRSFIDFWIMREMGQEDAIFRNYDLLRFTGGKGNAHLWSALKRIGFRAPHIDKADMLVTEVAQRIANTYNVPRPDERTVRVRLIAWYSWDRIRKDDIDTWYKSDMRRNA